MNTVGVFAFVGISSFFSWFYDEPAAVDLQPVSHYPVSIDQSCMKHRSYLYDECGDQQDLFVQALAKAKVEDKVVFVNYGAEWCIWCHVMDNYLRGRSGKFKYDLEGDVFSLTENEGDKERQEAVALNAYASESFVVLHLESNYSANGYDVLELTGADQFFDGGQPYNFTVTFDGKYATHIPDWDDIPGMEIRDNGKTWYRGFNRLLLLEELERLTLAAR